MGCKLIPTLPLTRLCDPGQVTPRPPGVPYFFFFRDLENDPHTTWNNLSWRHRNTRPSTEGKRRMEAERARRWLRARGLWAASVDTQPQLNTRISCLSFLIWKTGITLGSQISDEDKMRRNRWNELSSHRGRDNMTLQSRHVGVLYPTLRRNAFLRNTSRNRESTGKECRKNTK